MKSAFLIVAHGNFEMLKFLIRALDYKDNDIYIHFDKKCGSVDYNQFESQATVSHVECIKNRIDVAWGGVSQIRCTFALLSQAMWGGYDYYHLISGVDFPLMSNEDISSFLEANKGCEFVGFTKNVGDLLEKLGYYHCYDEILRQIPFGNRIDKIMLYLQKLMHIRQYRNIDKFHKGCNWWSITHALATALINEQAEILHRYRYVLCCDELFVQTFVKEHLEFSIKVYCYDEEYKSCMRLIDWDRGNPYTFTSDDYEELSSSTRIFARKFGNINTIKGLMDYKK